MPDETTVAATGQGQPAGIAVPGADGGDDAVETTPLEDATALKRALQAERRRADGAEKKLKAEADAKLSETERLNKRLAELEAEREAWQRDRRDAQARDAVTDAAEAARAKSPRRLYRLIKDDLRFDDDGQPTNVAQAIAAAKREFPELFGAGAGSADGGAGGGNGRAVGDSMNDLIRQAAGRR